MNDINAVKGITAIAAYAKQAKTLQQVKTVSRVFTYSVSAMLIGYTVQLLNLSRDISAQAKNVIFATASLTLLMAIPIAAVNIYFVSRRRSSNTNAKDSSQCSHSITKEAAAWAIPFVTVVAITCMSWGVTRSPDLHKPIDSTAVPKRVTAMRGA